MKSLLRPLILLRRLVVSFAYAIFVTVALVLIALWAIGRFIWNDLATQEEEKARGRSKGDRDHG